jgi:ABC-type nitrate/sulfonate/bicarbonate transport system permease component
MTEVRIDAGPGSAARPRSRRGLSTRTRSRLILIGILLAIAIVWEITSLTGLINRTFFPAPTDIIAAVPEMAAREIVREAIGTTLLAMLATATFGIGTGVIFGYVLGFSRVLRDALMKPALFLLSVPKSIFIPIFLLLFGIDFRTAIIYGVFASFIYVMVNVVGGFELVEPKHLTMGRAFGANTMWQVRQIILPASLPGLFTGIWYGLKGAVEGIIILELFVSITGLGSVMSSYSNELRTAPVFAIIFFFSILAILLGTLWSLLERRLTRWRPASFADTLTSARR